MNKLTTLALFVAVTACSQPKQEADATAGTGSTSAPTATRLLSLERKQDQETPEETDPDGDEPTPEQPPQPVTATSRKIIRNATLRIRVSNFAGSGRAIDQAVRQTGGQIANSNETKSDNSIENELTIRVPAPRLDELLTKLLAQSIFTDTKTITADDVTRQYVDVEARIRSKKIVEETYLKLLKQARSVADVLKIEEQLGQIREEREVQEAELRQLKDEVALSTVNLTYYQQTEEALRPEEPFYTKIGHNLADGFGLLSSFLIGIFYFLPLGIVATGIIWLFMRWRRRRIKKGS